MAKVTKKEQFANIKAILGNVGHNEFDEFLDHEIEILNHKKSSTNSKAKKETDARMEKAFSALAEMAEPVTITELRSLTTDEEVAGWNPQRLTALFNRLGDRGVRTENKGKAYFSIA